LIEPINLFRIEGGDVAQKTKNVRFPGSFGKFIPKDSFIQGPTADGNWAIALDPNDVDSDHDWDFDILYKNGWVVSVELKEALGKKVAIPFSTLGISEEELAMVSVSVVGLDGSILQDGLQVHLGRIWPTISSYPYSWGGYLFIKPPTHSQDLPLEDSKVEGDLPLGAECLAIVADPSKILYGGLRFLHDGTPRVIHLRRGRQFHGRVETDRGKDLPQRIRVSMYSIGGDHGWTPEDTFVQVTEDGSFGFTSVPKYPIAATKEPGRSLHVEVRAARNKAAKFNLSNVGADDVDFGTIHLESKAPFLFVDVGGKIPPSAFAYSVLSARSLKRSVTIGHAEEAGDGTLALYRAGDLDGPFLEDDSILISLSDKPDELYRRGKAFHYRRMEAVREYSASLLFSRELGRDEVAEIGWTWKKDGPLAFLGRVDDLGSRAGKVDFKFQAPPTEVFLSLRLVSKEGDEVLSRKTLPFQGGKLFATFP